MNGRVNHILSEVEVDVVLVLVLGEHLVPRGGGDILKRLPGPAARPRALTLTSTNEAPHLWLCGHFTAKSFTSMVRRLDAEADMIHHGTAPRVPRERRRENYLFWATKSSTQPRGGEDEWTRYQDMPVSVRKWGDRGEVESTLRPGGHVDSVKGGAEDYRHLMKAVPGSKL